MTDEESYCGHGCGRPALTEEMSGMIGENIVVIMVCGFCDG